MKEIFRGYYQLDEKEFKKLWKNAVFIFDTNVLLNLYRYQSNTKDSLLDTIENLSNRVWIPYHVGLEFHRRRLTVIKDQNQKFSEVRDAVDNAILKIKNDLDGLQLKKRHSLINPDGLLDEMSKVRDIFFKELESLEQKSLTNSKNDQIIKRIQKLLGKNIGDAPESQEALNQIFEEGEKRYLYKRPPGFRDMQKNSNDEYDYVYEGLSYKAKYGDLILWKQLIEYAKQEKISDIVFVTDDKKDDWWWETSKSNSNKIGVHPELKDEIYREAGVERFHMYTTDTFLEYANQYLGAEVKEEAIEEVRDVARRRVREFGRSRIRKKILAKKAVFKWLSQYFDTIRNHDSFPRFRTLIENRKYGFEILTLSNNTTMKNRFDLMINRSYSLLGENRYSGITLLFVALDDEILFQALDYFRVILPEIEGNLGFVIGKILYNENIDKEADFIPYQEYNMMRIT